VTLSHVLDHLDSLDLIDQIRHTVGEGRTVSVEDLPDAVRPLLAAATVERTNGNVIVVTSQMDRAHYIASIISAYTDPDTSVEI